MKYSEKLSSRARKLISAVKTKNPAVIPHLIGKFRGYVITSPVDGCSPLHAVAQIGHTDILKIFAGTHKVDVCVKDSGGFSALQYVLERQSLEEVRILVDAGANVDDKSLYGGQTALHVAAENNVVSMVMFLVAKGADVNARDARAQTPLLSCAFWNDGDSHLKLAETLLKNGADVNARDERGRTALHHLVYTGNASMLKLFFKNNADVDVQNEEGDVPLFHAVHAGRLDIAQLIIDRDMKSRHESKKDWSVHWNHDWRTLKYLSEHAGIPTLDIKVKSPLNLGMSASYYRELFVKKLKFILRYLDVYITDGAGNNLLQICEGNELWKITVLEHLAKLQALKLPISECLLDSIHMQDDCSVYFSQCLDELEESKRTKLGNSWVSYFNLLVDSPMKLKNYAGNRDLIEDFKKGGDCLRKFQIYGAVILENVKKGVRRRKLYDRSCVVLSRCLGVFGESHLVVRDVLDCVSTRDLTVLCGRNLK